jgi:hypothetical protein
MSSGQLWLLKEKRNFIIVILFCVVLKPDIIIGGFKEATFALNVIRRNAADLDFQKL